jgi:NodT family efflux transporter outer membrane factor (OMF) lipoprotein
MKFHWVLLTLAFTSYAAEPEKSASDISQRAAFREVSPVGKASPIIEPARWWKEFRDPVLDSLIERAARKNLDVRIAASRLLEARAASGIARSALLPSLGQNISVNRIRGGFSQGVVRVGGNPSSQPGSLVSPFETGIFQTGFETRWELDLFGGLRKNLNAAQADTVAARESYRDVMLVALAEVARNYMELRGLQQQFAIAVRNRDAQQETLELTRIRADAGLATVLDVERQAAQLGVTQAAIPGLESAKRQTIHRVSVLLGEEPGALAKELEPAQPLPFAPPEVPAGLPYELLKRRPDIRRAEAEIAAATARAGAARRELFPKFVITGFFGRQATDVSGLTLGAGNFFGIGPGIQLPLFTGGRIRSNIAVHEARLEQAVTSYDRELLAAAEEVENALAACRYEQQRHASLSAAVSSNRQAVELARELYLAGTGDFLSVLEAQQALYMDESRLVENEKALVVNLVALYKALGGGW